MEEKNNKKIVFLFKPLIQERDGDDYSRFMSFVGLSSHLEKGLKRYGYDSTWWDALQTILKEKKDGKYTVDGATVYIIPESFTRLHTQQYPLVILDELEKIIDIDEWWYTPFKSLIFQSPIQEYTKNHISWRRTDCVEGALENGYLIRYKPNSEDTKWLYGLKTQNITFNIND